MQPAGSAKDTQDKEYQKGHVMNDLLPGRTEWETAQYRQDHGQRAATALGLPLLADFIRHDNGPVPPAGTTIFVPVTGGTDEDRMAAVDGWAAEHHIQAEWDSAHHHYAAKLWFGPVGYMVYMLPSVAAESAKPELAVAI